MAGMGSGSSSGRSKKICRKEIIVGLWMLLHFFLLSRKIRHEDFDVLLGDDAEVNKSRAATCRAVIERGPDSVAMLVRQTRNREAKENEVEARIATHATLQRRYWCYTLCSFLGSCQTNKTQSDFKNMGSTGMN
jgi:hypothetical protein